MSNAIGSSRESNPSRRICHLRAVPLGHVTDNSTGIEADANKCLFLFKKSLTTTQLFNRPTGINLEIKKKILAVSRIIVDLILMSLCKFNAGYNLS